MYLLNTSTLKLRYFINEFRPKYAILSHRWDEQEMSFQLIQGNPSHSTPGFEKVKKTCEISRNAGYEWCWIDSCCIDKSSSAELTESINSMYQWYQEADVCYAYLSDCFAELTDFQPGQSTNCPADFAQSLWFTRGWTLQELIAPSDMVFLNARWNVFGSKADLAGHLTAITYIPQQVLISGDPHTASVAQRMAWASFRQTTRLEDEAYSLLGLFAVNMPMLYGEGRRAFTRLQEEIIKQSDDMSIFVWDVGRSQAGMLASSPKQFQTCHDVISTDDGYTLSPYAMTNFGLSVELSVGAWAMDTYVAKLDCSTQSPHGAPSRLPKVIFLMHNGPRQMIRVPDPTQFFENASIANAKAKLDSIAFSPRRMFVKHSQTTAGHAKHHTQGSGLSLRTVSASKDIATTSRIEQSKVSQPISIRTGAGASDLSINTTTHGFILRSVSIIDRRSRISRETVVETLCWTADGQTQRRQRDLSRGILMVKPDARDGCVAWVKLPKAKQHLAFGFSPFFEPVLYVESDPLMGWDQQNLVSKWWLERLEHERNVDRSYLTYSLHFLPREQFTNGLRTRGWSSVTDKTSSSVIHLDVQLLRDPSSNAWTWTVDLVAELHGGTTMEIMMKRNQARQGGPYPFRIPADRPILDVVSEMEAAQR